MNPVVQNTAFKALENRDVISLVEGYSLTQIAPRAIPPLASKVKSNGALPLAPKVTSNGTPPLVPKVTSNGPPHLKSKELETPINKTTNPKKHPIKSRLEHREHLLASILGFKAKAKQMHSCVSIPDQRETLVDGENRCVVCYLQHFDKDFPKTSRTSTNYSKYIKLCIKCMDVVKPDFE